jgi:core-2/I-Branching enzyme
VSALRTDDVEFFVHVDRRTPAELFEAMRRAAADAADVAFVPRHASAWGTFGHVKASLEGIRAALAAPSGLEYALLLTGQDYPLRTNAEIAGFLHDSEGRSFMEHEPLPRPGDWWKAERGGLDRIERWHLHVGGRHLSVRGRRRLPAGLHPFGGSAHWTLSRACLEHVERVNADHPAVTRFFRFTRSPDELFFQTILLNSPLADTIVSADLRYTKWWPPSPHPEVLDRTDLDALRAARGRALFARKFDADAAPATLDLVDSEVRGAA